MVWWLWTAFDPPEVHVFDVDEAWYWATDIEPDVAWLGEGAWVFRVDLTGVGLRTQSDRPAIPRVDGLRPAR